MRITGGLKEHLGGTDHRLRLGISRVKSFRPEKQVSSPTSDVQLLLHALDVGGRFLLDEVEDLDGIGHPEEDVLQVREKVGDGEAGQGGRVLAGETLGVLQLLLLSIPLKLLGRKEPAWGNARKAFAPRLPPPQAQHPLRMTLCKQKSGGSCSAGQRRGPCGDQAGQGPPGLCGVPLWEGGLPLT